MNDTQIVTVKEVLLEFPMELELHFAKKNRWQFVFHASGKIEKDLEDLVCKTLNEILIKILLLENFQDQVLQLGIDRAEALCLSMQQQGVDSLLDALQWAAQRLDVLTYINAND